MQLPGHYVSNICRGGTTTHNRLSYLLTVALCEVLDCCAAKGATQHCT